MCLSCFGTFNSRTLHSCCYLSVLGLFLGISCCFIVLNTLRLWHFDFWISISCQSHVSPKMLSIICSPFVDNFGFLILFWVQFYVFVFLILWCIFFLDLSSYLYFRSVQVLETSILLCLLKFLILFFIPVRFPLFSWKRADCFDLLQFICLLELSEILDFSSSKCYKKVEKRSTSKFQVKKIINEIRSVCNFAEKNTVIWQWFCKIYRN